MNFLNPYSRIDYKDFFQNKLLTDEFEFVEEELSLEFKPQYLKRVELLGRDKSLELDVYEILHDSENDPRVGLSKDIFRLMSKYGAKRALAILYSPHSNNYRLSLATVELSLEGSKIKREYSNPRRYSFFLGSDSKIHTPSEFLISKGSVSDFEDLQNRFSIEVVNKEFYQRIAVQFSKLIGGKRRIGSHTQEYRRILSMPSVTVQNIFQEFAVRLIGRLVFCWFLKMKKSDSNIPLISAEVLSLDSAKAQSNYYHTVLEKLFFEVLNTPIDERKKEYKKDPYISIPFLNGGLFNPHSDDYYEIDKGGDSKFINTLKVPDKWLQEFIEILEIYNFTVDENTSVDIDLSVDPEMLGRIFENLLAEINPETGDTARKATGSYYTPRPIVEYMVDESLKQYLITATDISEDRIIELLSYGDGAVDLKDNEKEKIVDAFDKVKILDPACGSGAFPIGILQKMLLALKRVDPNSQLWLNKQLDRVPTSALRNELKRKLEYENVEYVHKLGIIQNSIYGVDIQPIAAEISKLRCFLSLIVDEKVYDDKYNRGILPLPNLEFKFVAANSLVSLPKSSSQSELFNVDEDLQHLEELRKQFFTSSGKQKKNIEKEFLKTQKDLVANYFKKQAKDARAVKLANWNPFSDEATDWFDPEWMFGFSTGFHIIIGNPPYIRIHKQKAINKAYYKLNFKSAKGDYDIYVLFIEKCFYLLRSNGVLSLITPDKYLVRDYGNNLREIILKYRLIELFDLSRATDIFDASVYPLITLLKKEVTNDDIKIKIAKTITNFNRNYKSFNLKKNFSKTSNRIEIVDPDFNLMLNKILSNPTLNSIIESGQLFCGTPRAQDYHSWKNYVINKKSSNSLRMLVCSSITPYNIDHQKIVRTVGLVIASPYFQPRGGIISDNRWEDFKFTPKILIRGNDKRITAVLDDEGSVFVGVYAIKVQKNIVEFYKYLLACLNSKLYQWIFSIQNPSIKIGGGYFSINSPQILNLPFNTDIVKNVLKNINDLVDKIISAKKTSTKKDIVVFLDKIDLLLYKIYNLTYLEVKIIDPDIENIISEKEYEKFELE